MSRYVPITELPSLAQFADEITNEGEVEMLSPMVTWDIELPPYINTDRIELNMSRIEKIHRIGSFVASFVTEYSGQKTRVEPTIVGMNGDGTAIAGKKSIVTKGNLSNSAVQLVNGAQDASELTQLSYGKAIIQHKLNSAEIEQNVMSRRPTSKTRDGIWAEELARGLADSYRNSAATHLGRSSRASKLFDGGFASVVAGGTVHEISAGAPPTLLIGVVASMGVVAGLQQVLASKEGLSLHDRRWSLVSNFFQPEAYFAIDALSRMPGLLRTTPKS